MAAESSTPPDPLRATARSTLLAQPAPSSAVRWSLLGDRRCRVILFLLLGLVALDGVLAAHRDIWSSYDPDDYLERLHTCGRGPRDLIVVGGSPVSEGIDPAMLAGIPWQGQPVRRPCNMGLPGATTTEVWHGIKHGIPTPPRVLVYGLSASDLNESRQEPHGARSLMTLGDLYHWVVSRPESAEWVTRKYREERLAEVWQLYRYRNAIRLWAADAVERLRPGAFPDAVAEASRNKEYAADMRQDSGFAPQRKLREQRLSDMKATSNVPSRFHFLERYHLGGHLANLHRILDWGEKHGVTVVLVDMPVPPELDVEMHPQAFITYRAALEEVARQRRVPLIHASRQAVGLEDTDFADLIHLNAQGTRRLSAWLRNALPAVSK